MVLEIVYDGGFEIGNAAEDAAPDGVLGDEAEEALHQIEPGGGGGGEVQAEARMPGSRAFTFGCLWVA